MMFPHIKGVVYVDNRNTETQTKEVYKALTRDKYKLIIMKNRYMRKHPDAVCLIAEGKKKDSPWSYLLITRDR